MASDREMNLEQVVKEMNKKGYSDAINPQKAVSIHPIRIFSENEKRPVIIVELHTPPYQVLTERGYYGSEEEAQKEQEAAYQEMINKMSEIGFRMSGVVRDKSSRGSKIYYFGRTN